MKCSNDHTTSRSSSSLMLYFCSLQFRNRLAYAIGCQLFSKYCSRLAPRPFVLASHLTRVGFFVSKCLFSIICVIAFLIIINAVSKFCSRHAPRPFLLASHLTRVGFVVSKCLFYIICVIAFLIIINAVSCSLDHFSFEPLMLFFVDSSGLRGAVISDRLGINFIIRCILPINDLSCFSVCGCSISLLVLSRLG